MSLVADAITHCFEFPLEAIRDAPPTLRAALLGAAARHAAEAAFPALAPDLVAAGEPWCAGAKDAPDPTVWSGALLLLGRTTTGDRAPVVLRWEAAPPAFDGAALALLLDEAHLTTAADADRRNDGALGAATLEDRATSSWEH